MKEAWVVVMEVGALALIGVLSGWICQVVRRRLALGTHERVRCEPCLGVMQRVLWRRAELRSHDDGLGGQSFPTPVETRSLVLMFVGLPLWTRCESIGLPVGSEARFCEIGAADFDDHFTPAFSARPRQTPAVRTVRTA